MLTYHWDADLLIKSRKNAAYDLAGERRKLLKAISVFEYYGGDGKSAETRAISDSITRLESRYHESLERKSAEWRNTCGAFRAIRYARQSRPSQ